MKNCLCFR